MPLFSTIRPGPFEDSFFYPSKPSTPAEITHLPSPTKSLHNRCNHNYSFGGPARIVLAISELDALRPLPPPRISRATSKSDFPPRDSCISACSPSQPHPRSHTMHTHAHQVSARKLVCRQKESSLCPGHTCLIVLFVFCLALPCFGPALFFLFNIFISYMLLYPLCFANTLRAPCPLSDAAHMPNLSISL